jgi:leader peptidase (prepilin peptidase)/N-methyltransferase
MSAGKPLAPLALIFYPFTSYPVSYNALVNIFLIIPVLLGILMGYLINYFSDEFPHSQRLGVPLCPNQACRHPFTWKDYLLLTRCRECGRRRSLRTFLVFTLAISAALYVWFRPSFGLGFVPGMLILTYLFLVGVIDFEYRLVLRTLSITGLVLSTLAGLLLHGWKSTIIGGMFGFGVMFVIYLLGTRFSRWISKKRNLELGVAEEVFGSGDVTLAMILGLFLGWPLIVSGLLFGFFILGIFIIPFAIFLVISRRFQKLKLVYIPIGVPFILSTIILIYLPDLFPVLLLQ